MPLRSSRRTLGLRAGATGAAAALVLLIGSPAMAAGVVVPLDPPEVEVSFLPWENIDETLPETDPLWPFAPIELAWGGSLVVQLPDLVDASEVTASLDLGDVDDIEPTISYSSDPMASDPLSVSDLGDGRVRVTVPADDTVNGPLGSLTLGGLSTGATSGVTVGEVYYLLQFDAAFPASETVEPGMEALSSVPCGWSSPDPCPSYQVTAGDTVELTVPPTSRLRALGLGTLTDAEVTLVSLADEYYTDEEYVDEEEFVAVDEDVEGSSGPGAPAPATSTPGVQPLDAQVTEEQVTEEQAAEEPAAEDVVVDEGAALLAAAAEADDPRRAAGMLVAGAGLAGVDDVAGAAAFGSGGLMGSLGASAVAAQEYQAAGVLAPAITSAAPYSASFAVPADTAAGPYGLILTEGDGAAGSSMSSTFMTLDIAAPPVAAAPVVNPGLRSNTGWTTDEGSTGSWALVATGAGMLLAAGAGAVVLVRPRPARVTETCE